MKLPRPGKGAQGKFRNEPFIDFSNPENHRGMEQALRLVEKKLGCEYPLTIGGCKVATKQKTESRNPSHPEQVIGIFQQATVAMASEAIEAASRAFESWKKVSFQKLAARVFRAAELIRKRKVELAAWLCYEIGKSWPEADADIAELIDFCEYYGREALRLAKP
jgi:1-pyrroline-5-carboxylate dehydrogenase